MTDYSRDRLDAQDEDRLPWLEPVEDEEYETEIDFGRLIAAVVAGLVAIGLVVGGVFWWRDRDSRQAGGNGEVIAAPQGDYKVKPDAPGGMEVAGTGDVAYGASEGRDVNATIDLSALPEEPMASGEKVAAAPAGTVREIPLPASRSPAAPAPAAKPPVQTAAAPTAIPMIPKPAPKPAVTTTAPAAPAASEGSFSGGGGRQIQLGAFSSEAKANAAWKSLSGRFSVLAPLSHAVTPVKTDSATLYRLRASAGDAASGICQRLKVAGESCAVIN